MSEWITKINAQQRMHMIENGLNPINPEHIKKYLQGKSTANISENVDRMKAIMGDMINKTVGHAEPDRDPIPGSEYTPNNVRSQSIAPLDPQAIKNSMMNEMDDYATSVGDVSSSKLLDIRGMLNENQPVQQTSQANATKALELGKSMATAYHNAYILSLKTPSTQANLNVFKALKALLEKEKALAGNQAQAYFKKGVSTITSQMYEKLKG